MFSGLSLFPKEITNQKSTFFMPKLRLETKRRAYAAVGQSDNSVTKQPMLTLKTVSYTHLDVYKRQALVKR